MPDEPQRSSRWGRASSEARVQLRERAESALRATVSRIITPRAHLPKLISDSMGTMGAISRPLLVVATFGDILFLHSARAAYGFCTHSLTNSHSSGQSVGMCI